MSTLLIPARLALPGDRILGGLRFPEMHGHTLTEPVSYRGVPPGLCVLVVGGRHLGSDAGAMLEVERTPPAVAPKPKPIKRKGAK